MREPSRGSSRTTRLNARAPAQVHGWAITSHTRPLAHVANCHAQTPMSSVQALSPNDSALQPGPGARLANLVVDPRAAFGGIGDSPSWKLAFVVAIALRFVSLLAFYRPAVTPLKVLGGLLFQISTVVPPLLIASLVLWLAANAWRVGVGWRSALAIVTHAYVAYTLATVAFASVAGAVLPASSDVDLRSPPFTNFALLLADSAPAVLRHLVAELDVRSVYVLVLLWLGLRGVAPGERRQLVANVVATIALLRLVGVAVVAMMQ